MGQKNRAALSALIAVIIIGALISAFGFAIFGEQTPSIVLPVLSDTEATAAAGDDTASGSSFVQVAVTPATVQSVIGTLNRPESYYRSVTLKTVSGDSNSTDTADVWVDSDWTRVDLSRSDHSIQHRIVGGDMLYLWYDQDTSYCTFPSDSVESDIAQCIPTYEDVLALDQTDITDAGYEAKDGYNCIYVEVTVSTLGYQECYWVSVDNGLLIAFERWKDDALIFQMSSAGTIGMPAGSDADFSLPDGNVLHSVLG